MNKKSIIKILLTVLMSMTGAKTFAHDIEVINPYGQTIYYIWTNNFTELAVCFRGASAESYDNEYNHNTYIPASVEYNGKSYSVTSIGEKTFWHCSSLTSITIPNSVTSIGDYAFTGCYGLTTVTIPNSVTSIGGYAFAYCKGLTSVTIGNSVTSIGGSAFEGCSGLTSVTIPNSVTSIGGSAFEGCSGLTSVTIPNSVISIGGSAFEGCSGLTSITIPVSVTSIGKGAFKNCSGLTSVHISDLEAWCGIEFGSNPLYNAHHLYLNGEEIKDLVIPNSVKSISSSAFSGCSGLTSVTIPNSVTSIGDYAFADCYGLTSMTIPNSVTSIGDYAFTGCYGLTSVTIPNSVTFIGCSAFAYCKGLTSVTIGNSVTSIGDSAFYVCYGLTSVTIPNSVTFIGGSAFSGCSGLTSVNIGNSVESIGNNAFLSCTGLTSVTIPNSVTSIGRSAFEYCNGLTSITIPNSVTSIGQFAFANCSGLTSVTIPNSVTDIYYGAFSNSNITTIYSLIENPFYIDSSSFSKDTYFNATLYVPVGTIDKYKSTEGWKDFVFIEEWTGGNNEEPSENPDNPDDVSTTTSGSCGETANYSYDKATHTLAISGEGETYDYDDGSNKAPWSAYADEIQKIEIEPGIISVGYFAFYKCSSLTSLSVPATLKYIGLSAFEDCTSLSSLSLNEGLLIIEGSAFKNCNSITEVYCYAKSVPKANKTAFDGTPIESATLYVPANSVKAYKASRPWSDFKNIVAIGSTPVDDPTSGSCGETANYSYDKDTHTLTISGEGEIYDYDDASNKAPWSAYADEIQKIEIELGIISVGYFAFYKCSSITSLSFPATVKYIGSSAFEDCTSLSSLSLNEGLLIIEGSAFKNCNSITEVYCYAKSVPKANKTAFDGTPIKSATLYVPANSVEAYKASRPWSGFKEIVPLNGNPDGIIGNKQSDDVKTVYSIKGEKLLHPTKGVNIIKMKDGTIKKVFVK